MSLQWRVVPIERWPGEQTIERRRAQFRTTVKGTHRDYSRQGVNWSATTDLLERELGHLGATNVLLQMAVRRDDIRLDGWVRANAVASHPGVILTFDSIHGPLSYPCDTYDQWQANVRAIAVSLENLRAVDRHGVTRRGEQYRGWAQLPPAGESTSTMTAEAAARLLVAEAGFADDDPEDVPRILRDPESFRWFYREAAKGTHPDTEGGTDAAFQRLQEAKRVLDRHHGATVP